MASRRAVLSALAAALWVVGCGGSDGGSADEVDCPGSAVCMGGGVTVSPAIKIPRSEFQGCPRYDVVCTKGCAREGEKATPGCDPKRLCAENAPAGGGGCSAKDAGVDGAGEAGGDSASDVGTDVPADVATDPAGEGGDAVDSSDTGAVDAPGDVTDAVDATDAPKDVPVDVPPPTGCADGTREGFKDVKASLTVAACGGGSGTTPVAYTSAKAFSTSICAAGWHWCKFAELDGLPAAAPSFDAAVAPCAWVDAETSVCTRTFSSYGGLVCGGTTTVTSSTHGTGACTMPAGGCTGGWRPMISFESWAFRALRDDFLLTCRPHLSLGCGTDISKQCWVACCQD